MNCSLCCKWWYRSTSKLENLVYCILPFYFHNKRSINVSAILRNRCRLSITTWSKWMLGKRGAWETLNFFGSSARSQVSWTVRAAFVVSIIDHACSASKWSLDGHLHHIHAYVHEALSMPLASARNFQSPAKKYSPMRYSEIRLLCN